MKSSRATGIIGDGGGLGALPLGLEMFWGLEIESSSKQRVVQIQSTDIGRSEEKEKE